MHQAGGKSGRPKNKYTAEALETIKQDLTRFQVQKDNGIPQQVSVWKKKKIIQKSTATTTWNKNEKHPLYTKFFLVKCHHIL